MDQVWKEDAKESGAERRFQEMFAAQADEMDKSKREAAMKTARALAGGQLSHLMKLIFEVWADDVRISKEERMRQGFMDQFAEQDKQKKQQMERMVANMFGRSEKQLMPQVVDAWKGVLFDAKMEWCA